MRVGNLCSTHSTNNYAPGLSYEVRSGATVGDAVAITIRISIPCTEGIVWREAAGNELLDVKGYGDPTSNAEAMALRRREVWPLLLSL
jgi:hypothetical protein